MTVALPSVKVKHSAKVAALSSAVDSDTRQRWPLCRVPPARHSAKVACLPSVLLRHSANRRPLPSAWPVALGKSVMFAECNGLCTRQSMFPSSHFAECHGHCTRQSDWKQPFFLFFTSHPNKQKIYITNITNITYIINITYVSPTPHIYHKRHIYITNVTCLIIYHK